MKFLAVLLSSLMLVACGGGGGGGNSSGNSTAPTITDFSCDETAALAKASKLTVDLAKPAIDYPYTFTLSPGGMLVTIDGKGYYLWARVVYPDPGVAIRGVWMYVHGIHPAYTTATLGQIVFDPYDERRAVSLGYIAVSVARRGNFGSEGTPYSPQTNDWVAQYQSHQITYAQLADLTWGYQADSVIGALNSMRQDLSIAPYLNNLVLAGFSGGAETVLYVAAKSPVFAAATHRAIIRGAGRDSALDHNPEAAPGYNESLYKLSSSAGIVPAFWYGGTADPITSAGKLSCAFGFSNQRNGVTSNFLLVNGMEHGGPETLTADFQANVMSYLKSRSMPGF